MTKEAASHQHRSSSVRIERYEDFCSGLDRYPGSPICNTHLNLLLSPGVTTYAVPWLIPYLCYQLHPLPCTRPIPAYSTSFSPP
ncbi:hypothetical protein TgHK011_005455 [Trichoderma gracile]|nr:hypothetical protein TgHK011_005455 [Trichoderma gracile]